MDRAFKDVNTKDQAITELMNLQMTDDQLDAYNTTFNQLLRKCKWNCDEQGTMQLYCRGLITSLLRRMLDQDNHPDTLDGWQDLAIKYQGKWLEAQHKLAQRDSRDTSKQKAYLLKLLNQKWSHSHTVSILKTTWMWTSQKPPMTKGRRGFAIIANSLGISRRIVRREWLMNPKERNYKHKYAKSKSLTKKKKTSSPQ
jgi:hypothetical protein